MVMCLSTFSALLTSLPLALLIALHALAAAAGAAPAGAPPPLGAAAECVEPAVGAAVFFLGTLFQAYACKRAGTPRRRPHPRPTEPTRVPQEAGLTFCAASHVCGAVRAYAELCTTLSPMDQPVQYSHMPLWRLALAYLGYCVVVPLMCAYCFCSTSVEWAGVRYTFRDGKVHQVHRRDAAGQWVTQSREESMERALRAAAERRLADQGLR